MFRFLTKNLARGAFLVTKYRMQKKAPVRTASETGVFMSDLTHIKDALRRKTVNGKDKYIPTVNSKDSLTVEDKIQALLDEENITPEGVAEMLAETLDDKKSLTYYLILVKEHGAPKMLEIMHYVKDVARTKAIRNKALYFMAILKRKNLKTKFKKEEND